MCPESAVYLVPRRLKDIHFDFVGLAVEGYTLYVFSFVAHDIIVPLG
jgi:hypothetical protein